MVVDAQNTNNTTIRSILLAEKLIGLNFTNWYRNLRIVLRYKKKIKFVEKPTGPVPDPKTADPDTIDKYYETVNLEQEVVYIMLSIKAFHACKREEGQLVSSILLKMKSYLDTLERLGYVMPNELGVSLILNSLNKDYDQFVQYYNMHNIRKTIAELYTMLKFHEKGAKGKDKGKNKLAYDPKPNISPPPKRDNPAKDSVCHHCKEGLRESRKLKHGALSLYKENGMRATRDGVLQPTHDESLEKCKSCISGKMARKPFSHQVERAKDLLGLIHTHVCGPFRIVSRKGASYFITLTDDFSRYGYVYLMKHKQDVFETFKVFQNEFENQLGKKIKVIQSDQGGEYLSHKFVNHMKSYGIVSQLTPPYTPQHNGVSERRNRTLLDMVRSMMNLTTLPKSFWGYALEFEARILNMVPTKKVERTPYEIWHGKAPKLSYLRVWGCEALVKRDTHDKLDPRSINIRDLISYGTFATSNCDGVVNVSDVNNKKILYQVTGEACQVLSDPDKREAYEKMERHEFKREGKHGHNKSQESASTICERSNH
ncbi:retrotransposon protein, putative, ty1-copia subclass [Tanacetum coccineum]